MYHTRRNRRTDLALINSGEWAKVGRKHYRHESGVEVRYNCNRWAWEVSTDSRLLWPSLEAAAHRVTGRHYC